MFGGEGGKAAKIRLDRSSDAVAVLVGVVAALALVGPLRVLLDGYPAVRFLCAVVLFLLPGALLARWFAAGWFPGAALVPAAFVLSVGVFGFLGLPLLFLKASLGSYLLLCGLLLALFAALAALRAFRTRGAVGDGYGGVEDAGGDGRDDARAGIDPLWVPFAALGAVLAALSRWRVPGPYEDSWVYLAWVREFLGGAGLAARDPYFSEPLDGLSRAKINGWLLEQAALSKASGIGPVELVQGYLNPALVVVALLSFYALARALFGDERAALVAGSLCALFFLANMGYSLSTFGGELVARATEDKFVARFEFLPVALVLALAFAGDGRRRQLGLFAFVCWSAVVVHPVGLAVIGLCVAGFGVLRLATNPLSGPVWRGTLALAGALLSVLLLPALYFLFTGEPPADALKDADINSNDPDVLANMAFVRSDWKHLYELDGGRYIMHPYLILEPAIRAAFLVGVPFLLWRLVRDRRNHEGSPESNPENNPRALAAAQLLLGALLLATFVVYVPPVATFVGDNVVLPGQLWRLAWPIPLAALLTMGWLAWGAARGAGSVLGRLGAPQSRAVARSLPLVLVVVTATVVEPTAATGAEKLIRSSGVAPGDSDCLNPVFRWMGENVDEPSVVFAPDAENTCIPAYSPETDVVSLRGASVLDRLDALRRRSEGTIEVPRGARHVRGFFGAEEPPSRERAEELLRLHEADYALARTGTPAATALEDLPALTPLDTPSTRYVLYEVDRRRLGEQNE